MYYETTYPKHDGTMNKMDQIRHGTNLGCG